MRKFVVLWFVIFLPLLLFGERTMTYRDKQVYRGPVFDKTDAYNFHIDSVIVTKDTTYIFSSYFTDEDSWANISDTTYLENIETKERFYILKSIGLPYSSQKLTVKEGEDYEFVFLFPSIGDTKNFNFIENDTLEAFNIYNIDLNNCTNGILDYVDINQLTHLKDSLVSANDTIRSIKAMELISNVKGYFLGFKSEDYLTSLLEISGLYNYFGLYEETIMTIDEIIHYYHEINEKKNVELGLLHEKAKLLEKLKKTDDAISIYNQYISLFNCCIENDNKDWPHYVKTIALLANCYYNKNDKNRAAELFKECLNVCNKKEIYENYLEYLLYLCLSYSELEKYDDAISVVNREGEAKLDSLMRQDEFSYFLIKSVMLKNYFLLDELEKAKECKKRVQDLSNYNKDLIPSVEEVIKQYNHDALRISDSYFAGGIEQYKQGHYEDAINSFVRSNDYLQEADVNEVYYGYENLWIASCFYKLGREKDAENISKYYKSEPLNRFTFHDVDSLLCKSDTLLDCDSIDAAINLLHDCVDIVDSIGNDKFLWLSARLPRFVRICMDHNKEEDALDFCLLAIDVQKLFFSEKSKSVLQCNIDLHNIYFSKNDYGNAIKYGRDALYLIKSMDLEGSNIDLYPSISAKVAFCMSQENVELYANEIREKVRVVQKAMEDLFGFDKDSYTQNFIYALKAAEKIPDRDLIFELCDSILPILRTYYQTSTTIQNCYFYVLDCLFYNHSQIGEPVLAVKNLQELKSASENKSKFWYLTALTKLLSYLCDLHLYGQACELFEKSKQEIQDYLIELSQDKTQTENYGLFCYRMAWFYYYTGLGNDAINLGESALKCLEETNESPNLAIEAGIDLMNFYLDLGYWQETHLICLYLWEKLEDFYKEKSNRYLIEVLHSLSQCQSDKQKEFELLVSAYKASEEYWGESHHKTLELKFKVGQCYASMGYESDGLYYMFSAIDSLESKWEGYETIELQRQYYKYLLKRRLYEGIMNEEIKYLDNMNRPLDDILTSYVNIMEAFVYSDYDVSDYNKHICFVDTLQRRVGEHIHLNYLFSEQSKKLNSSSYNKWHHYVLPQLAFYKQDNFINCFLYNSRLQVNNMQVNYEIEFRNRLQQSDDSIQRKYKTYIFEKNILQKLNEDFDNKNKISQIRSVQDDIKKLEKELLQYYQEQESQKKDIHWEQIRDGLSLNDIAIEFVEFPDTTGMFRYIALTVKNNSEFPRLIPLFKMDELGNYSNDSILYHAIWKPLEEELVGINKVYFSTSGKLNYLPIENLLMADGRVLSDQYELYRLSSTAEIVSQQKKREYHSAALYGGIKYEASNNFTFQKAPGNQLFTHRSFVSRSLPDSMLTRGGFDNLEESLLEVKDIKNSLVQGKISVQLLTDSIGTEQSLKNMSGQEINILHFATHGMYMYPEDAEQKRSANNFKFISTREADTHYTSEDKALTRSFLVMAGGNKLLHKDVISDEDDDGILTALEISLLDFRNLELVVLSACQSGLGDTSVDGVVGLQRGFKKAGANTILMSLDKVDDEATRILMVDFYKNLMSGKTKLQSLNNAQRHLRQVENGKYDKPEYWASFIMLDGLN